MAKRNTDCGEETCPECGGSLDAFSALTAGFSEVADGHHMGDVIEALCFTFGEAVASQPAEGRSRLRREVGAMLNRATKLHVIQNCDA